MSDYPKVSETIFDAPKTNTEMFLEMVKQHFPSAIKDGEVDFDALKEEMGEFAEIGAEHYDFTWAGKQAAKKEAMSDILGRTLKFKPEDSLNADTTENIYIEGDNLEALKLLRRNYYGKIKMIYIDPPYNTGNDFVYKDYFTMSEKELSELSGATVDGVRMQKNSKDSAKYHTNWLNMIYPRLRVAKDLLTNDGVIFISIDDNEVANMKNLCNEVFESSNFVAQLVWEKKKKGSFLSNAITNIKEYILIYCKTKTDFEGLIGELNSDVETYPCINAPNKRETIIIPAGIESKYKEKNYLLRAGTEISDTTMSIVLHSDLVIKDGVLAQDLAIEGNWRYSKDTMREYALKKELYITRDLYIRRIVSDTRYKTLKDILPRTGDDTDVSYKDVIDLNNLFSSGWGSNEDADEELRLLLGTQKLMDYPKPTRLIVKLIASYRNATDCIIVDFFSGSATTAHAVMQLNAEDGGNRKYIMVQLPEPCDNNEYKNICEIGKERIRRAAKKIHNDKPDAVFDDGFKVFTVDDTNIRWTHKFLKDQLEFDDNNISDKDKLDFMPGYKDTDVVYEIMLRQYGIPLSTPIEKLNEVSDRTYIFADSVVVCLDENITSEIVEKLASLDPTPGKFIFRDSAFEDDIELKDVTFRRLSALVQNHFTEDQRKKSTTNYTVEFI